MLFFINWAFIHSCAHTDLTLEEFTSRYLLLSRYGFLAGVEYRVENGSTLLTVQTAQWFINWINRSRPISTPPVFFADSSLCWYDIKVDPC